MSERGDTKEGWNKVSRRVYRGKRRKGGRHQEEDDEMSEKRYVDLYLKGKKERGRMQTFQATMD